MRVLGSMGIHRRIEACIWALEAEAVAVVIRKPEVGVEEQEVA
jgi:hypothetical protein